MVGESPDTGSDDPVSGLFAFGNRNGNRNRNSNSQNTDDTDVTEPTRISLEALLAYLCFFRMSVSSVFWLLQ